MANRSDQMETQESSIDILNREIQLYRKNQVLIEGDLKKLKDENNKLSQQIKTLLRERASCVIPCRNCDNLIAQNSVLTKEKESFQELWQTSQRTINALDSELKEYKNLYLKDDSKATNHKDLLVKFKASLEQINELESKLHEAKKKDENLLLDFEASEVNVNTLKEEVKHIKKDLEKHKNRLKFDEELRLQLEKCKSDLETSLKREVESKFKVQEAVNLLDIMITQKNDAAENFSIVTEKLALLKANTSQILEAVEVRLRAELEDVKEKYDEKISDMLQHVQILDAELVDRGFQVGNLKRENNMLKESIRRFEKLQADNLLRLQADSVDLKEAIAEKRLEAVFRELVLSERRNISLASENHCLVIDCQRRRDIYERDLKRREWEISLMKTEVADYKMQIEHLQKSLTDADTMVEKLQNVLSSKNSGNIKVTAGKDEELKSLNEHIHNQMELNKKWRQSYIDMTDKLRQRLEELIEENKALKNTTIYLDDSGVESNMTVS